MRIRYCFIEDQDCTKLTKGKTPDILMSLYESMKQNVAQL